MSAPDTPSDAVAAIAREVAALRRGAGLHVREARATIVVSGADAADYLHRMLSQDVRGLAVGHGTDALLLTPRARIVGDPIVWRYDSSFVLDVDGAAAEATRTTLERYVIADDVVLEDESSRWRRAVIAGPDSARVLEAAGLAAPDSGLHAERGGVHVLRHDVAERPAFELRVPRASADETARTLVEAGAVTVGSAAWDVLRVEACQAVFGVELDERVMPLEARLDETAISFGKGCYPGQEPVVMAKHRGHPPSLLVRVAFEGSAPAPGTVLLEEGARAGRVTTAVDDPERGPRGLAYVRFALAEPGRRLALEGGGAAEIGEADAAKA